MLCTARLVDALSRDELTSGWGARDCCYRSALALLVVVAVLLPGAALGSVLFDFDTLPDTAGCSQPVSSGDVASALAFCDVTYVNDNFGGIYLGAHEHTVDGLTLQLSSLGYIDWRFGGINCGNTVNCGPGYTADFSKRLTKAKVDLLGFRDFSGSGQPGSDVEYFLRAYAGPGGTGALLAETTAPGASCDPVEPGCNVPTTLMVAPGESIGSLVFGASGELGFFGPVENLGIADNLHVNPVPEPGSALVFGAALLAAHRHVRRRHGARRAAPRRRRV